MTNADSLLKQGQMLPCFLIPSGSITGNGSGEALNVSGIGDPLLLTLGIEHVKEQESLLIGVYGSADGTVWDAHPLIEFPQKFYAGASAVLFDPPAHTGVQFIRAQWKTARWGRGDKTPVFQLYLFAELLADKSAAGQPS